MTLSCDIATTFAVTRPQLDLALKTRCHILINTLVEVKMGDVREILTFSYLDEAEVPEDFISGN